jgi:hypothetical protein
MPKLGQMTVIALLNSRLAERNMRTKATLFAALIATVTDLPFCCNHIPCFTLNPLSRSSIVFLLLLALLSGLVLGQFIKIELPPEAKQELIRAIKSISGTVKAAFDRLMSEIQQQRSIYSPLQSSCKVICSMGSRRIKTRSKL